MCTISVADMCFCFRFNWYKCVRLVKILFKTWIINHSNWILKSNNIYIIYREGHLAVVINSGLLNRLWEKWKCRRIQFTGVSYIKTKPSQTNYFPTLKSFRRNTAESFRGDFLNTMIQSNDLLTKYSCKAYKPMWHKRSPLGSGPRNRHGSRKTLSSLAHGTVLLLETL